jgi:hypothetical protein
MEPNIMRLKVGQSDVAIADGLLCRVHEADRVDHFSKESKRPNYCMIGDKVYEGFYEAIIRNGDERFHGKELKFHLSFNKTKRCSVSMGRTRDEYEALVIECGD